MFTMGEILRYVHDEADDANFFHRPKNGEVRLFAFMRRGVYLLFLEGMLAGKMRGGMDANNYVLFVHTPYHVS